MLSLDLSWHFFARGNWVYKTRFIYRVLETQFFCDVSIHVEITDLWVPPGNRVSETRFLIGFFQKIKRLNTSHSRTYLSTLCHSPSHAFVTPPPSHLLHPLMLTFLLLPTVAPCHAHSSLTLTAPSLTLSTVRPEETRQNLTRQDMTRPDWWEMTRPDWPPSNSSIWDSVSLLVNWVSKTRVWRWYTWRPRGVHVEIKF